MECIDTETGEDIIEPLRSACSEKGLDLVMHSLTHWQIKCGIHPLVDYWPTTGKFRLCNSKGGAQRGKYRAVLEAAEKAMSARKRNPDSLFTLAPKPNGDSAEHTKAVAKKAPMAISSAARAVHDIALILEQVPEHHQLRVVQSVASLFGFVK